MDELKKARWTRESWEDYLRTAAIICHYHNQQDRKKGVNMPLVIHFSPKSRTLEGEEGTSQRSKHSESWTANALNMNASSPPGSRKSSHYLQGM